MANKVAKRKGRDLAGGMRQCQLKVNWPQKVVVWGPNWHLKKEEAKQWSNGGPKWI